MDSCKESEPEVAGTYQVGDKVWVRLPSAHCDERHGRGTVTRVLLHQAVDVDGVPRHVKDLHLCTSTEEKYTTAIDENDKELYIEVNTQTVDGEEPACDATDESDHVVAGNELERTLPQRSSRIRKDRMCTVRE